MLLQLLMYILLLPKLQSLLNTKNQRLNTKSTSQKNTSLHMKNTISLKNINRKNIKLMSINTLSRQRRVQRRSNLCIWIKQQKLS